MTKSSKSVIIALLFLTTSPLSALGQSIDPSTPLPTGGSTTRPVQAGVVPPSPLVVAPLTMLEVSQNLQARLIKIPGVRRIGPMDNDPNVLRLIAHNDTSIRLDTLFQRVNAPNADREAEFLRFENNVRAVLARTDPFKLEQLRVVIRQTAAINAFETESATDGVANIVVRRPFIDDLEEVVVGDTPTAIALMPASRLADLQLTAAQAFERGRANTLASNSGLTWNLTNGLARVRVVTGYETSLLALDSVWATIAQRLGGPVAVIVPTREKIVFARADRPRDLARLRALAMSEAVGERALSNKVWVRRGSAWVAR